MSITKLVFFCACLIVLATAGKITSLPGYSGPELSMYSGYVTVDASHGRALFYWLIEAQTNPDTAPLVVWFQGGPGCSSLAGLFTEHGPLRTDGKGGLEYTSLSWTNIANMLYVEAPAGVGFSYSNTSSDYNTDDTKTAIDNAAFIEGFLQQYPKYIGRTLWLTGESYAGVYVPTLVNQILSNSSSRAYQQLKGFMVGNPVFGCEEQNVDGETMELFYWHGLVSYDIYVQWDQENCRHNPTTQTKHCQDLLNRALKQVGVIDQELVDPNQPSIDPDNLYQDFCTGNASLQFSLTVGWPNDCDTSGDQLTAYLNRADVQQAIYARPGTKWSVCTNNIQYTSNAGSMNNFYMKFFVERPDLDILVYSGDVDIYTVPFAYTQPCLYALSQGKTVSPWQPWFVNTATAGYVQVTPRFTFATVKGAGHETPTYQPFTAYHLFSRFLNQQNLTDLDAPAVPPRRLPRALSQSLLLRQLQGRL